MQNVGVEVILTWRNSFLCDSLCAGSNNFNVVWVMHKTKKQVKLSAKQFCVFHKYFRRGKKSICESKSLWAIAPNENAFFF